VDIDSVITEAAKKYHVNREILYDTLDCESQHFVDIKIQSGYRDTSGPNGKEDSWGVAQIHLPAHRDISKEQAQDPVFAINWTAQQFASGGASQWTCYRLIKANQWPKKL
jgi:hypothetical protein